MEKYYVLEKFALWKTTALSALEAMQIKRKAIAKNMQAKNNMRAREIYQELEFVRNKVMDALMNLKLLFCEAEMDDCAEYTGKLYKAVKGFNLMTPDYTGFIKSFVPVINQIPNNETTNSAVIGRLMNNVRTGYYPTDLQHVRKIKESLVFPEGRRINALDTCCGCGLALEELTRGEIADTYGIEIDEIRGHEAEQRLDRVGFGSFFYSRMSRDAFHLLFLNPPYISVMKEGGGNTRAEKKFLVDSIYHLMDGGVLVYIIPYYRLTSDICRILCDNFSDLRVYRFAESEFKKFKQVAVIGIKKPKADGRHNVYFDMLSMLRLEVTHRNDLLNRGLSFANINQFMYKSVPRDPNVQRIIIRKLSERYDLKGIPGFYRSYGEWKMHTPKYGGFFIPVCNHEGYIQGMQIRYDKSLMNSLGYDVNWEDNKKYITFVTPDGKKCRNRKLYPRNLFTKASLENQFSMNAEHYGIDKLNDVQERFIRMVKNTADSEKYPISYLVEKSNSLNLEGMNYEDWYDINREISIDDDKYDTYRSLGYVMKRAVNLDDFKERLQHLGMNAEFDIDANVSVFISKQGVEYDNTELYMGEKYTPSELQKTLSENSAVKHFKEFFRNAAFRAHDMNELRNMLLEEGYILEYNNNIYSLYDADGNIVNTSAFNKDFDTLFKESGIIKFLYNHKWTAESFDEFIENVQADGCDIVIDDNKISYAMFDKKYQNEKFNLRELEEYYAWRLDRKELRSVLWQVKHAAKSKDDFIEKMSELGYKVEWSDDGDIKIITPSGRTFTKQSLNDEELTQEQLEEQFQQNEINYDFDLFTNIMRLLRQHGSSPMSSSGLAEQDLTGEKLRDFLYHFEKGSASKYNKNLNNDMSM